MLIPVKKMRTINTKKIISAVKKMSIEANTRLPSGVKNALSRSCRKEKGVAGKVLSRMVENYRIAEKENIPVCQDTGIAVVFLEIGQDVHISGGDLYDAVNEGIRQGYGSGYLRKSVVKNPLERKNTLDNTPAVIHTGLVPGSRLKITFLPKGAGSENMSAIKMFDPSAKEEDIRNFVVDTVKAAYANPCPPVIVGVGIGGTFDYAALLSKKALLRRMGSKNRNAVYSRLEKSLLSDINKTGIGPQGFGGKVTALGVFVESYPCHIASLPVAVNIQCHAARCSTITL